MTEDDRHLLLEVKAMLTSGAWGNTHSVAPLLGSTKQWYYGRTVELTRGPHVINVIAVSPSIYEKWEHVFELNCFDLLDDKILVYFHSGFQSSNYAFKLDMLIKWAKDYYIKRLEEEL